MATDAPHVASSHRGGRVIGPGPRKVYLAVAAAAIAAAVIIVLAIQPGSSSSSSSAGPGLPYKQVTKYGDVPKQIKIPRPVAPKIVTATAKQPDLSAMQGYPVNAKLSTGSAQVFMEGPAEPGWVRTEAGNGTLKANQTVPGTFEVTFTHVSGTVPLSASEFSIITYEGTLLHPRITTSTGGALPARLPAGKTLTLTLSTSGIPEGDGAIRWAPVNRRILVSYFWTLELD